jgi:hypothetical protein
MVLGDNRGYPDKLKAHLPDNAFSRQQAKHPEMTAQGGHA